jgi:glycosyltransferase involved in cell wall biosynthesis
LHAGGFSLLVIGTEADVFDRHSDAAKRMEAYAAHFRETHLLILTSRRGLVPQVRGSVHLHPAASRSRIARFFRAWSALRLIPHTDVITAQDPFECGLLALLASRRSSAALHIQVHTDFLSPAFARHSFLNRARVFISRFVLPRADALRTVSKRVADSLTHANIELKTPPSVLPIFVDIERFRNIRPDTELSARFSRFKTKVVLVSRLESEKNPALAVRALAETPMDTCLIVVGEGSERARLFEQARALRLSDRVFLEGRHASPKYYALADLVLVTSRYEGYGRVFVEAGAAGKPVLSTDVGIAREHNAVIADEKEFGRALRAWIERGAREGHLPEYPYRSFEAYVEAYCADIIRSCEAPRKTPY